MSYSIDSIASFGGIFNVAQFAVPIPQDYKDLCKRREIPWKMLGYREQSFFWYLVVYTTHGLTRVRLDPNTLTRVRFDHRMIAPQYITSRGVQTV